MDKWPLYFQRLFVTDAACSAYRATVLAVPYADGLAADRFLAELGYRLRNANVAVAGLVQHDRFVRHRAKCEMEIEELATRTVLRISEFRGNAARGCRLDRAVLADAVGLMKSVLASSPTVLILNKFGKVEAEGGGLRDVIADAVQLKIPTIVGVPLRNIDQWRKFAGVFAEECDMNAMHVFRWLSARNLWRAEQPASPVVPGRLTI